MARNPLRRASIATLVRMELARQNKTKKSLSDATGISVDTLRRRLDGVYPFTLEEVDAVCRFFDIPVAEFVARARELSHG